jgi:glycosyltransferase involved in cell wall biosynthesis
MKNILSYLARTGKYELIEFCNSVPWGHHETKTRPWACQGSYPVDQQILNLAQQDSNRQANIGYGAEMIDKAIAEYKPDIYIGMQDPWGLCDAWKRKWWNKLNHIIWCTIDSLPILPQAIEAAENSKNFYVWAGFAKRELNNLGHPHVDTLHGSIKTDYFYRLDHQSRFKLKERFFKEDDFVIGYVFRNQLRKTVSKLIKGFKTFKKECPNAKLLLHTSWKEGWDIPRLLEQYEVDNEDVYTTYYCKACANYELKPFNGHDLNCPLCGSEKTQNTTNIVDGVDEVQLNEIYNLMDVYCHPFTSGGMEVPIFEAKLTELITLVTDYSCGEEGCSDESGGLPLKWAEYPEFSTQFSKAATSSESIVRQLRKVYKMPIDKRRDWGKKARQYTIDNYSIESVGSKLEGILDELPLVEYEYDDMEDHQNIIKLEDIVDKTPAIAVVIPQSGGDVLWVNSCLHNLQELYPEYHIYVFTNPQFYDYIEDHPVVYKMMPYSPEIDNAHFLEGKGSHKGYFDLAFFPHCGTQKFHNYHHNGIDRSQIKL